MQSKQNKIKQKDLSVPSTLFQGSKLFRREREGKGKGNEPRRRLDLGDCIE